MKQNFISLFCIVIAGNAFAEATPWEFTGNAVIIHQAINESYIRNEPAASADLVVQRQHGSGIWLAHIEASSTPESNSVSGIVPEANADAGSALDKNSEGRLQLSELYYTYLFAGNQTLSAGLLDVSGFFEQSRIASDETTQFMGAFFTGNPTIGFPDYTVGIVYEAEHLRSVYYALQ